MEFLIFWVNFIYEKDNKIKHTFFSGDCIILCERGGCVGVDFTEAKADAGSQLWWREAVTGCPMYTSGMTIFTVRQGSIGKCHV